MGERGDRVPRGPAELMRPGEIVTPKVLKTHVIYFDGYPAPSKAPPHHRMSFERRELAPGFEVIALNWRQRDGVETHVELTVEQWRQAVETMG